MNETWLIVLLVGLMVSAAMVVLLRDLLKACIGLSMVSAILSVVMFVMGADLAAVFELSVCAGLITVVFVSTISMSKVLTKKEVEEREKQRWKRFRYLPWVMLAVLGISLTVLWPYLTAPFAPPTLASAPGTGKEMIWNLRQTDLLAQVIMVLVAIYGVLIFFKNKKEGEEQ